MFIATVDRRRCARRHRLRRPFDRPIDRTHGGNHGGNTGTLPTLHQILGQDRFVPLAVALERSGLDDVIDGLDDFVLIAPTSAAFASSGTDTGIEYPTLMNSPQLLEATMRYHIVADPSTNRSWRTLNGSALEVDGSDADTIERVDGVEVLDRIHVRNGTVLVVPRLLLPTRDPLGTAMAVHHDD